MICVTIVYLVNYILVKKKGNLSLMGIPDKWKKETNMRNQLYGGQTKTNTSQLGTVIKRQDSGWGLTHM